MAERRQRVDDAGHPLQLVRVVDRSEQDVVPIGRSGLRVLLRPRDDGRDELVVHVLVHEHPGRGRAVLARVEVSRGADALRPPPRCRRHRTR